MQSFSVKPLANWARFDTHFEVGVPVGSLSAEAGLRDLAPVLTILCILAVRRFISPEAYATHFLLTCRADEFSGGCKRVRSMLVSDLGRVGNARFSGRVKFALSVEADTAVLSSREMLSMVLLAGF